MLSSNSLLRNNSWVSCLKGLWLDEGVLVGRNELSLVVGASISDNDLGGVLIWHHNSWLGKSASESIWVVWLKRLLQHTGVEVLSNLVLILGKSCNFRESLAIKVHWLWSTIIERDADSLTILLQDLAAGCDLGVFEHSCRGSLLVFCNFLLSLESFLIFLGFRLLFSLGFLENFL